MNTVKTLAAAFALSATLAVGSIQAAGGYSERGDDRYDRRYDNGEMQSRLRDVIDRTQSDLREATNLEHRKGDERDRYKDAQGHLSSFDRNLTKGKFDKSELNKSIDKIKEILDKNVLQASSRDMLLRDMTDLKFARARRD